MCGKLYGTHATLAILDSVSLLVNVLPGEVSIIAPFNTVMMGKG